MAIFGGMEAGGTKFVCAVSDQHGTILDKITFPTEDPLKTLGEATRFFDAYPVESIGIGSFGPIDIAKDSATYGFITTTPKVGWSNTDIVGHFKKNNDIPIAWTTDVNAAAAGELSKGAALGSNSCLYLTVGTGIGGGAILNGKPLEGYGHPEMGHVLVRRHPEDTFPGTCPYHGDCLEGLAAGPAIEKRYGKKAHLLTDDPKVWEIEAYYLAQALVSYSLILSPDKIVLGGGVMKQTHLFPLIRKEYKRLLAGYIPVPDLQTYIVPPKLGDDAGIVGCLLLAQQALEK